MWLVRLGAGMTATLCPRCQGSKTIRKPKMALLQGRIATVKVEELCMICKGRGYVPGIKPLV